MKELSTRPYLIRGIYEWCVDSGLTPYLSVRVDSSTRVPVEYVKDGLIVLNISQDATRNLTIGNDLIQFSARFNGVSRELTIPVTAVIGIFARENGQGFFFPNPEPGQDETPGESATDISPDNNGGTTPGTPSTGKRKLQVVK